MTATARHSARATAALQRLSGEDPALGALAHWCAHRDAPAPAEEADAPPAWTDGATIFYGPGFERLAPHEQAGVAAHQILHVAFRHPARAAALRQRFGAGFDADLFNLATDAILNQTLLLAGHSLPWPRVELTGLLAEALGETLSAERALAAWDAEKLYVRLAARAGADRSGRSAREAERRGAEPGRSEAERARDFGRRNRFAADLEMAAGGAPEGTGGLDDADWARLVARALEAGRQAGRGIGVLGRLDLDLPRSGFAWEVTLRALVTRALTCAPRPAWNRPARRWIARDADAARRGGGPPGFEPGTERIVAVPRIAVCIDSSGSVDAARLGLFAAQIAGIGRRTGAEIHVLVFDDGLRSCRRMQGTSWEREIAGIRFARDGGTSFVEVIDAAAALDPSAIVVLTDLDGPFGPAPRRIPVIWAVPGGMPPQRPPFGRLIALDR